MSTVIERAREEAKRQYPFLTDWSDAPRRMGFIAGATFAASITPEQVEAILARLPLNTSRSSLTVGLIDAGFEVPGV